MDALRKTKGKAKYGVNSPPPIALDLRYACCTSRKLEDLNRPYAAMRLSRGDNTTRAKVNCTSMQLTCKKEKTNSCSEASMNSNVAK